jgi:DMATS type aromatic prenyltransferase
MSSLSLQFSTGLALVDSARQQLHALWGALHRSKCPTEVHSLFETMFARWGSLPLLDAPGWPSDVGDDHSPFEFSVALTPDGPEIRLVVEAQGERPGFASTRAACLRLNDSLAKRGADLGRYEQVHDLFLPEISHARFALWHAVALAPGALRAKAYLNPQIRGAGRSVEVVQSAFDRLGMPHAWRSFTSALSARPLRGEEIRYFALDLDRSDAARVKIYLYRPDITTRDLERLAALRPGYTKGEVTEFCRAITGTTGPYRTRPPCVYVAFTGRDPVPSAVTVQVPIAHYVTDDRVARDRIRAYLRLRGVDGDAYDRALQAVAWRPLEGKSGLHTYVSLRTGLDSPRVTTYFAAELYRARARSSGTRCIRLTNDQTVAAGTRDDPRVRRRSSGFRRTTPEPDGAC